MASRLHLNIRTVLLFGKVTMFEITKLEKGGDRVRYNKGQQNSHQYNTSF